MNVGHPGNLSRIFALYGGTMSENGIIKKEPDLDRMRKDMSGISVSDEETRNTIADCFRRYGVLFEPHGAVAWKGLECYHEQIRSELPEDQFFVSLETAHPAKFSDEISRILGFTPPLPSSLKGINERVEEYAVLENSYEKLKEYILKN
jgi:threonine synthase